MKFEEIKTKSQDELKKTLLDLKKEQMELRFKQAGGQVEKTHEIRAIRRNIARVQTALNAPATEIKAKAKPAAKKMAAKKKTEEKAA
jgi:large subunit ribosomal protein L29